MTFKELAIGQTFDFIPERRYNSFFDRCERISARKYRSLETGYEYEVWGMTVRVFNPGEPK